MYKGYFLASQSTAATGNSTVESVAGFKDRCLDEGEMDITEMVDDGTVRGCIAASLRSWGHGWPWWMSGWVMINVIAILFSNQRCYSGLGLLGNIR